MPFEQAVNLSGTAGDALTARSEVRDVAVLSQEGEDGGRILRAEVQLLTVMTAVESREMTVLRDVYTTEGDAVETQSQTVTCWVNAGAGASAGTGEAGSSMGPP